MEYIVVLIICIISVLISKIGFGIKIKDIKELKKMGHDEELNKLTNIFPKNIEICREILDKLKNPDVKVIESDDNKNKTSLYVAISNTIFIANIKDTFTRIQTIAHECIHSVQNRKLLLFNFIFSNMYLIYFAVILVSAIFNKLANPMLHIFALTLFGFIYYFVRSYLETDAMIKARYVAKEYMQESKLLKNKDIDKIINGYDNINNIGIRFVNFNLFTNCILKVAIFTLVIMIKMQF